MKRKLSTVTKKEIAYIQKYYCGKCNLLLPPSYEVDHIVPFSITADDSKDNLVALCPTCHSLKTQRERERIIQFKKLNKNLKGKRCWFCLKEYTIRHMCDKILSEIRHDTKKTIPGNLHLEFSNMCIDYVYEPKRPEPKSNTLYIKLNLDTVTIHINNFIYKAPNNDMFIQDIKDAVTFATEGIEHVKRYENIKIKIEHSFKNSDDQDTEDCFEYIADNIEAILPERILNGNPLYIDKY